MPDPNLYPKLKSSPDPYPDPKISISDLQYWQRDNKMPLPTFPGEDKKGSFSTETTIHFKYTPEPTFPLLLGSGRS
jgi:hypothetical protein